MTPEMLKTEIDRAEEAELQSDEQLRQLTNLIDKARAPNATISAADCSKIVGAALALNERLRGCTGKLRTELRAMQRPLPQMPTPKA